MVGAVIYTGQDTRIAMNTSRPHKKVTSSPVHTNILCVDACMLLFAMTSHTTPTCLLLCLCCVLIDGHHRFGAQRVVQIPVCHEHHHSCTVDFLQGLIFFCDTHPLCAWLTLFDLHQQTRAQVFVHNPAPTLENALYRKRTLM